MPGDADGGPYTGLYGSYDPHGNMGAMPHLAALDWNFKDQLAAVNLGGGGVCSYSYDAAGQRVRKVWQKSAALSEERIVLNGWELFRRRSGGMLVVERQTLHLFDGTRRIAVIDTTTVDDTGPPSALVRFQLGNHLDSALLELDEHGDVISYEEYYPFGSTSYQAGRTVTEVSLKRYRHMAKERDDESGLYYYGARYYAPWLGRWTSCDPERLKDGLSVYVFTRNRPVTLVDVGGHESAPPFISRYLTDVLPPIMSVLNKHGIPPDRAIWLVVQAWSEQGPSLGLPSNSDNRIFNQQFTLKDLEGTYTEAQIKDIDARLKKGETVDLGGGVKVRNILQNESTDLAHKKMKVSPTYVYDNLEASVEHHLTMLGRRFAKARADLSDSTKTVGDFFKDLHTYGHVPDEAQQHERTQRIRDGKPLEEKHMFYDELVMQKRLGTVTDNLKKWDMNELDAKLNGMYSTVASLAADYGALQTQYAELYKEFEKTGDPDIAARLGQIKAEQQQIQRNAKGVLAEADALLAVRDQLKAAIKGLP
jgi:RHS repeat-associated protein